MIPCKTLIRTSASCLHFGARMPTSGLRLKNFKTHKQFPISRNFCSVNCAVHVETSKHADGITVSNASVETAEDCKDTVEELLTVNKDDVTALMKMERIDLSIDKYDRQRHRWFPYIDKWKSGDSYLTSGEVLEAIDPYLMESRKDRFKNVVNNRTYSVSLVVEGLSDFGNVSAAFRSADALGIQSVHVVSCDSSRRYRYNRHVSMGAEKWLDIELWDSVKECFGVLKSRGYRIATTHLGMDTVSVYDVDWSIPTAIVVGNELKGISDEALELSDLHCSIPMRGMVDSFNVSVAAGLLMHHAVCDRTLRMGSHGDLTQDERKILLAEFYLRHNKNAISIANEFSKRKLSRL